MKILVIEDDQGLRQGIAFSLTQEGYQVLQASSGKEGYRLFLQESPQGILLDLNLPDMDGNDLCRKIRETFQVPILMLTARDMETDEIMGLSQGADDYMTKPFGVMELISRVKAMLRRANLSVDTKFEFDGIILDEAKHLVTVNETECELTFKEFELLKYLMQNAGIVLQRYKILDRVWGMDYEGESRTLDMHIKTLRKKLGDKGALIQTVRNVGYTMNYRKVK